MSAHSVGSFIVPPVEYTMINTMMGKAGFKRAVAFALVGSALAGASNWQIAHAQTPNPQGVAAFVDGIDALNTANYPRAVQSLTNAINADGDNASYRRARGIAYTLSESFPDAITDLERARRLNPNDTEAALWLAAAYRMSGDVAKGASLFTMRDLPHDYANMVYNLMAMQYWQSRYQGSYYDPATRTSITTTSPVKALFPDCAKAYADRNRATGPGVAEAIAAQMKSALGNGDWALALRDLIQLRANAPDDPMLRGCWAQALVGAGNALQAREEFTRTLCVSPLWADGYVGRAQAHMMLGDAPRAQADLEAASSLGAGSVEALQKRLSAFAVPSAPADAVQKFQAAVQSDVPFGQLVEAALDVHRLTNTQRQFYDESYQLRIRVLSQMMRDQPDDSRYPEMLARYLYNNYQVPVFWNGPRGGGEQARPQSDVERDSELHRAIDLCDAALKIDPKNANALATEAWILFTIKAVGAETLADQALAIDPDNVPALQLKSRLLGNHASDCLAQAAGLRAGHTDVHDETRSDGVYRVTTHYAPTAEQLAQAAQLEVQAAQLREQQSKLQSHEHDVSARTIPALVKQGGAALDSGSLRSARKALMAAYSKDPDRRETLPLLADLCKQEGDSRQEQIYNLLSQPLEQTTAAPDLQAAWNAIVHTQWQAAGQPLDRAASIDPVDARTPAYRSVIEAHRDTPDFTAVRRWENAALALEEARAREAGTTLLAEKIPALDLFDLPNAGLSLALHLQAGNAALASGQLPTASAELSANVAMEKRLNAAALLQLVPNAMLPDPTSDPNAVPSAPTCASLLAASRFGLAKIALASHQPDAATAQYAALRAYLANWPATAPNRETMVVVDSWARFGQAEAAYAAHDNPATLRILESDGWPFGLPQDLETRHKKLADQVHAEMSGQSWHDVQQQMNQSPTNARIQGLQDEIASIQKQRDSIAADIADPKTSDRQKQMEQSSLSQLDDLIAQRKAALEKLQGQKQ